MRKFGIENFQIRQIEQGLFSAQELQSLEAYYIVQYNSIGNGYNTAMPVAVEGSVLTTLSFEEVEALKRDYSNGMSLIELAVKYQMARNKICNIVKDCEKTKNTKIIHKGTARAVVMYDLNYNPVLIHDQTIQAIKYLTAKLNKDNLDLRNGYSNIKQSALKGSQYLGYRWQYLDTLYFDNKVFRTIFDIENYKTARYKTAVIHTTVLGDIYICGDLADSVKMGAHRKFRFTGCKIVDNEGNVIVKQSTDEQYKINRKANNANKPAKQNKLDIYRESPWKLVVDLREHGSYSAVARLRGCQPNALKKLALQLGYDVHYVNMLNDQEYIRLVNEIKVRSEA